MSEIGRELFSLNKDPHHMKRSYICAILVIGIICGALLLYFQNSNGDGITNPFDTFDNGGRYDSTALNDMGVIYSNRSDNHDFRGGYSESINCPWGAIHNGIDFFLINDSSVIAAAPGLVEEISVTHDPANTYNQYMIHIRIRFNDSIILGYVFEPFTNSSVDRDHQLSMLDIEEGDWVGKAEQIGYLLRVGPSAHIHFSVYNDPYGAICPRPFFGQADYTEIMELVHTYQPTWDLCYP